MMSPFGFLPALLVVVFSPSVWANCPYISVPVGTNRSSDGVAEGLLVLYDCLDQTQVFDNGESYMSSRCLSTGEWSKLPHPCTGIKCGLQPLIHHSAISSIDTYAGVELIYRCFYGFGFSDNAATKIITCNETTLEWVFPDGFTAHTLSCDMRYCREYPPQLSTIFYQGMEAYDVNGSIPVGSVINGFCKEGYYKVPSLILRTGKCAASGLLDGVYQNCIVRLCEELPLPPNAMTRFSNLEYQRRVRYECERGYFPGGKVVHSMECDHNGQWKSEPSPSGCQVGACDEGWIKYDNYCYYISDHTSWGLRYYYAEDSCLYKKSHLAAINSSEENVFLYRNTYRKYERDYWIGYHFSTLTNEWEWFKDDNETIVFNKWHRGYPELEKSCARLTVDGVWKDRNCDDLMAYICKKPTMCGSPPVIENGSPDLAVIPNTMDVGDTVVYDCNPGYSFRADATTQRIVTCLLGAYYSSIENCQPIMCPPLNRVGYFIRNAEISSGSQASSYMNSVTWTCNPGYIFPDGTFTKDVTCLGNRTWSYVPDMCIKVYCPVPGVLNAIPQDGGNEVGFADYYTCETGYEFPNGDLQRLMICQLDGSWIPSDSCWKKKCQPYVQYDANITAGERGEARYQDIAEITCDIGYQFPDGTFTKRTRCGPEFHWTPYLPLCEPRTCTGGSPPLVRNASANTTEGIINTVVEYSCDEGLVFIDGDTVRVAYCDLYTLQWMDVPKECLGSIPIQDENVVSIHKAASIATAAVAVSSIIVVMWVIVCSDCNEDRQLFKVCNNCEGSDDEDDDSYEDSESQGPEPVRLEMVM